MVPRLRACVPFGTLVTIGGMTHPIEPAGQSPDDLLTTAEVAKRLGVNWRTVARWARDGRIPSARLPNGHFRFRRGDIEALAAVDTSAAG